MTMYIPTHSDINRICKGFNDGYDNEPELIRLPRIKQFCDKRNGVRLELDAEIGRGYWELFRPNRDLLVCIADGMYHAQYRQTILPGQDFITIRFLLSGGIGFAFKNISEETIPQSSASLIYTGRDKAFDLAIHDGTHLCSVTFHIRPEFLYKNFGINRERLPRTLVDALFGGDLSERLFSFPLSPGMSNNVLDLINMPYQGARRRLFTEAKTAELICRLFQEIEQEQQAVRSGPVVNYSLKNKVFEAQKVLVKNYAAPPTIQELARHTGLNRSTLSAAFKEVVGTTIFEFCQDYRMNKARELLQNRKLSISQVAEAIGYGHPTNFTAAFKKHFGFLPKAVRPSRADLTR